MNALTDKLGISWDEARAASVGHVFVDDYENGIRFLIMRGPGALCAYVGHQLMQHVQARVAA